MSEATGAGASVRQRDARQDERIARRIEQFKRKCGEHGKEALNFAYHAALPVALNPEFLHLLRINFFVDIDCPLPYEVEFELLLSSLCRQIDEGLYEVERDVRLVLLEGVAREFGQERMREVAMLLWEYIEQQDPWTEQVGLERAQQLTALNWLAYSKAQLWLSQVEELNTNQDLCCREWIVAMQAGISQSIDNLSSFIGRSGEMEKYLRDLDQSNSNDITHVSCHLDGLGGMGKSALSAWLLDTKNDHDFLIPFEQASKDIDLLTKQGIKVIVISGEAGLGKTKFARQYLLSAKSGKNTFDILLESCIQNDVVIGAGEVISGWLMDTFNETPKYTFDELLEQLLVKLKDPSRKIGILINDLEKILDFTGKITREYHLYMLLLRALGSNGVQSLTIVTTRRPLQEPSIDRYDYPFQKISADTWMEWIKGENIGIEKERFQEIYETLKGNPYLINAVVRKLK